jgi:hypothetical protein
MQMRDRKCNVVEHACIAEVQPGEMRKNNHLGGERSFHLSGEQSH